MVVMGWRRVEWLRKEAIAWIGYELGRGCGTGQVMTLGQGLSSIIAHPAFMIKID